MDCEKIVLLKMFRSFGYVICVGVTLAFGGCTSHVPLQLTAVEIVDLQDQPHSLWTTGWTGRFKRRPPDIQIVKVFFSSEIDLAKFTHQTQYTIGKRASVCKGDAYDEVQDLRGDPRVYDAAGAVDAYRKQETPLEKKRSSFSYYIYIDLKTKWPENGQGKFQFDFRNNPVDVCFKILGGALARGSFTSNTLKITKNALIKAMRREQKN